LLHWGLWMSMLREKVEGESIFAVESHTHTPVELGRGWSYSRAQVSSMKAGLPQMPELCIPTGLVAKVRRMEQAGEIS
jgi:hypothetical protein